MSNPLPKPVRLALPLLAGCLWAFSAVTSVTATDASGDDWHQFRDKEGQEIEARVRSIAADLKEVNIERADGIVFDLPITRLCLDDQQYLRDWFFSRDPANPALLRMNLGATRRESSLGREKLITPVREAIWESSEIHYEIEIVNLATDPVPNLHLEFCLLLEDAVEISPSAADHSSREEPGRENDEDMLPWRTHANPTNHVRYLYGTVDLPLLAFNRPHTVKTGGIAKDVLKTARLDRDQFADRPIGLLARLVDSKGRTVAELGSVQRDYATLDWETFIQRRDPMEAEGSGSLARPVAAN